MSSKGNEDQNKHKPAGESEASEQGDRSIYHSAQAVLPSPKTSQKPKTEKATRKLVQDLLDKLNSQDPELSDPESPEKSGSSTCKSGAGTGTQAGSSQGGPSSKTANHGPKSNDSDIDREWLEIYDSDE